MPPSPLEIWSLSLEVWLLEPGWLHCQRSFYAHFPLSSEGIPGCRVLATLSL